MGRFLRFPITINVFRRKKSERTVKSELNGVRAAAGI